LHIQRPHAREFGRLASSSSIVGIATIPQLLDSFTESAPECGRPQHYLWRDIFTLRRAQLAAAHQAQRPALFELIDDARPVLWRNAAGRYSDRERPCRARYSLP
jgi:hypothetical protein